METINERIQLVIDQYYKGNVTAFSKDVGTTQSTIRDIVTGKKNKPSGETIEKILNVQTLFINPEWLLTGKGEMIQKSDVLPSFNDPSSREAAERDAENAILRKQLADYKREVKELTEIAAVLNYQLKQLREREN